MEWARSGYVTSRNWRFAHCFASFVVSLIHPWILIPCGPSKVGPFTNLIALDLAVPYYTLYHCIANFFFYQLHCSALYCNLLHCNALHGTFYFTKFHYSAGGINVIGWLLKLGYPGAAPNLFSITILANYSK